MANDDPMIKLLGDVDLFEGLAERDLRKILSTSDVEEFEQGAEIVTQDSPGGMFFVVIDGEVEVKVDGQTAAVLPAGKYFGEMSLLDGEPRSASVSARTPVKVLSVWRPNFRPLLHEHPSIAEHLLTVLSRRIRALERQTADK
jgi:CRP/FNR family transcriptional regulator/CRP/FNR family cyclic AMP-dependent transcriptional regulator